MHPRRAPHSCRPSPGPVGRRHKDPTPQRKKRAPRVSLTVRTQDTAGGAPLCAGSTVTMTELGGLPRVAVSPGARSSCCEAGLGRRTRSRDGGRRARGDGRSGLELPPIPAPTCRLADPRPGVPVPCTCARVKCPRARRVEQEAAVRKLLAGGSRDGPGRRGDTWGTAFCASQLPGRGTRGCQHRGEIAVPAPARDRL